MTAGRMLTAEELEDLFILVRKDFKKMELCAIHSVEMATMELAQFVGSTAQMASQTQVLTV